MIAEFEQGPEPFMATPEGVSSPRLLPQDLPEGFLPFDDAMAIHRLREQLGVHGEAPQSIGANAINGVQKASHEPVNVVALAEKTISDFKKQLDTELPNWLSSLENVLADDDLTQTEVQELMEEAEEEAFSKFKKTGEWTTGFSKLIKQSTEAITSSYKNLGSRERRKKKKGGKGIDPWWVTKCPKHISEERWKCATGIGPDRECKHWKGYTIDQ